VPVSEPRALETGEVAAITRDFVRAARMAVDAGFDGVELHGANGYLFEQFVNGALNQRADRYGGSIENRLRFMLETLDALIAELGAIASGFASRPSVACSTCSPMPMRPRPGLRRRRPSTSARWPTCI
jgi:2,4-dienoyl-CoA reductase-like NADH-dependent reductase (Old Yellow Enzyme family)